MSTRQGLGLSALCLWIVTAIPANAESFSRRGDFQFPCNGINQTVFLTAANLPASKQLQVVGSRVLLYANPSGAGIAGVGVQYVQLTSNRNDILTMSGQGESHAETFYPGSVTIFGSAQPGATQTGALVVDSTIVGTAIFRIDANCTNGNVNLPPVQGTAIIWFFRTEN